MKKAQMEGMETIVISIILIVIVVIGVLFYVKGAKVTDESNANKAKLSDIKSLATKLTYMPELSCPDFGASKTSPCIDAYKAKIFGNMLAENNTLRIEYYDLFKDSKVTIEQIYPTPTRTNNPYMIYNALTDEENVFSNWMPITIFDPEKGRTLGILTIIK